MDMDGKLIAPSRRVMNWPFSLLFSQSLLRDLRYCYFKASRRMETTAQYTRLPFLEIMFRNVYLDVRLRAFVAPAQRGHTFMMSSYDLGAVRRVP